ncbi:GNAT family N-acetyltransferase [Microbacterium sulfonylureivorans]|uniref:GNAT family N-acetyltransferase n=1 Tax=Microbacterium sulfonylureivorans TaxID=2486854 RepID=UPI000FDA89A9|nr:GNAT family N-acetyltransferase [Microbacterium sulfonylureivorans]
MTDLAQAGTLTVRPIIVPESVDAADAGPFLEMVRIANAVCLNDAGHDYLHEDADEMLGFMQDQTDWTQRAFAVERDGVILGVVKLMVSNEPDASTVEFDLMIDPPMWGQGAEELLLAEVEREARERGLATIQTWTLHRPGQPGEHFEPPTGWGSVPARDRQTVFQIDNGFTLEQVERNSVFDLTGDFALVERMLDEAIEAAGPDYRIVAWTAPTPAEHRDGFAYAMSRMSTDAPTGGMVVDEQHWDAARVERRDARQRAQGLTVSVAAVQHIPTGTIAAYNELVIAEDHTGATSQYGTLVLKEHRGHKLGTVVKCANLLRWRGLVPESPRVSTFNAEENRHMLDINEAIGFVPASYAGAWKKVLAG